MRLTLLDEKNRNLADISLQMAADPGIGAVCQAVRKASSQPC